MNGSGRIDYRDLNGGLGNGCGPTLMYVMLAAWVILSLIGCKATEYMPVVETHTEHHWHTDSVRQVDSVLTEKTTIVREADSATMARYGIQIKQMERAWLVQTDRLNREISMLQSQKSDTIHIVDSVPKIVIREVEKKQSLGDRLSAFAADAAIGVIIFVLVIIVFRLIVKKLWR